MVFMFACFKSRGFYPFLGDIWSTFPIYLTSLYVHLLLLRSEHYCIPFISSFIWSTLSHPGYSEDPCSSWTCQNQNREVLQISPILEPDIFFFFWFLLSFCGYSKCLLFLSLETVFGSFLGSGKLQPSSSFFGGGLHIQTTLSKLLFSQLWLCEYSTDYAP